MSKKTDLRMTVAILSAALSVAGTATLMIYICLLSSERCSRTRSRPSSCTQTATVPLPSQNCQALNISLYLREREREITVCCCQAELSQHVRSSFLHPFIPPSLHVKVFRQVE